ncbi:MAG: lysylphosphatidylglycerol synthase transmembrane domain-containing protein, partial [Caldanaerobacter sp.]
SGIFFITIPPFLIIFFGEYLELGDVLTRLAIFVTLFLIGLLILLFYIILKPHFLIGVIEKLERISLLRRYVGKEHFERAKKEVLLYNKNFRLLFSSLKGYRVFAWQFLYAFLYWMLFYSIAPLLLMAMKVPFSFIAIVGRQIIFYDILAYSFIPSGSGTVELGFAAIFSNVLPASYIGIFIGIWRFFTYYVYLGLSAVGFFMIVKDVKKRIVNQITT